MANLETRTKLYSLLESKLNLSHEVAVEVGRRLPLDLVGLVLEANKERDKFTHELKEVYQDKFPEKGTDVEEKLSVPWDEEESGTLNDVVKAKEWVKVKITEVVWDRPYDAGKGKVTVRGVAIKTVQYPETYSFWDSFDLDAKIDVAKERFAKLRKLCGITPRQPHMWMEDMKGKEVWVTYKKRNGKMYVEDYKGG